MERYLALACHLDAPRCTPSSPLAALLACMERSVQRSTTSQAAAVISALHDGGVLAGYLCSQEAAVQQHLVERLCTALIKFVDLSLTVWWNVQTLQVRVAPAHPSIHARRGMYACMYG